LGKFLNPGPPEIIVLAPVDYWQEFENYCADWREKVEPRFSEIEQSLNIKTQFVGFEIDCFEMGHGDKKPRLQLAGDFKDAIPPCH
jgi:hypothetical protein